MRKTEKALLITLLISILLKLIGISGGSVLFVLVSSVLSIYYFIFTFALLNNLELQQLFVSSTYSKISSLKTIGIIGLSIGLSLVVVSFMFILQHWIGSLPNLITSVIILLVVGIFALIKRKKSDNKVFYNKVLLRVGMWLFGVLVAFLLIGVRVN